MLKSLTRLPKLFYGVLLVAAVLFAFYYCTILVKGPNELSAIIHPSGVRIIGYEDFMKTQLVLNSVENKEELLRFYDSELKRNGWAYAREYESLEFDKNSKANKQTGYTFHFYVYEKGDLMLSLKWIRESSGRYINAFYMKVEPKH